MTGPEITLVVLLGAALVALFFLYRTSARYRKELQRITEQHALLERERPMLALMARHLEEDETHQLIRYRYNLMGRILAAEVACDSGRIDEILEEIDALVADRDEFLTPPMVLPSAWLGRVSISASSVSTSRSNA